MIHDDLVQPINDQITSEAYASQLYLQMSMWAEDKGLPGASKFFRGHVAEEMDHRNRLVDYLVECDAPVRLQAIPAPAAGPAPITIPLRLSPSPRPQNVPS